jgi:hypothetical protein
MKNILHVSKETLFHNLVEYSPVVMENEYTLMNDKNYIFINLNYEGKNKYIYSRKDEYMEINTLTDFYTEYFRVRCKRCFQEMSPYEMWGNKKYLSKIFLKLIDRKEDITPLTIRDTIFKVTSECNNFRITIAKSVYQIFNATRILDSSAGWGDRLLAALAWEKNNPKFKYYHATDPNFDLQKGYGDMINEFAQNKKKFKVFVKPFEDLELSESYDLIFSSPPFYILEDYAYYRKDKFQSTERYKTLESWFIDFLLYPFLNAFKSLEMGGHFVLNIEDTYGIKSYTEAFILAFTGMCPCCEFLGTFSYSSEDAKKFRPLWVWRKVERNNQKKEYYDKFKELYPDFFAELK